MTDSPFPGWREEWVSDVTIVKPIVWDERFPHANDKDIGSMSQHRHWSESEARRFKEWRESRPEKDGGSRWPGVEITLRRRYVTEWEEVE